ncbi:MAG: hypothetical protein HIU91_06020 [Acidobacteria bacterium]|nr:hypothetical protein [Acidobacteriota bacterium]
MVTASTLPVLLLIAILWRITKGEMLSIVLFTSAFSAASALNLGPLGVEPWLLAFMICMFFKLALGTPTLKFPPGLNKTAFVLLILFVLYAIGSAITAPYLFQGVTVVRSGIIAPLTWSTSNLAQSFYLVVAALLYVLTLSKPLEELESAVQWYIRACVAASLIAMYQLANAVLHIPYPTQVLYSNRTYVIYNAYKIGGMWRLNGPFCEASEMASFLIVGIALLGWELLTTPLRLKRVAYFILMITSLLMTLSSLGYASLIIMTLVAMFFYGYSVLRRGISPTKFILALSLVGSVTIFCTLSTKGVETVNKVIASTLIDKSNSDSYRERTATHVFALQTLEQTDYVGAGWGSLRASGLAYILLGTVGLPGSLLLLSFYLSLFRPLLRRRSSILGDQHFEFGSINGRELFSKSLFSATMLLCAMLIAGSEPVTPILWVLFGIATVAQSQHATVAVYGEEVFAGGGSNPLSRVTALGLSTRPYTRKT